MDVYDKLVHYLNVFISENEKVSEFQHHEQLYQLAQKNKVLSVVQYLENGYNQEFEINKIKHYKRIYSCLGVFKALDEQNVQYAVIKGAYLDKVAYKDVGIRRSMDIDILICKSDYKKVCRALQSEGFVCGYYDKENDKLMNYSRETILYHYLYTHQAASYIKRVALEHGKEFTVRVDINFSISWQEDVLGESHTPNILSHTAVVDYMGLKYKVLSPECFLLQLCLHSYRDMNSLFLVYNRKYVLRLLCDVFYYFTSEQSKINIDLFVELVKEYGYSNQVYYIFYYITKVFESNAVIEIVKNALGDESNHIINYFGLTPDEQKKWDIDFKERILCDDLSRQITPLLDSKDLEKIKSIKNNMWI